MAHKDPKTRAEKRLMAASWINRVWLCYTGVTNQSAKMPEYLSINTAVCTLFFNSTRANYIEIPRHAIGFLFLSCNPWMSFQHFPRAS
jgi:hypothetical protein